jgi:hypothetical protein
MACKARLYCVGSYTIDSSPSVVRMEKPFPYCHALAILSFPCRCIGTIKRVQSIQLVDDNYLGRLGPTPGGSGMRGYR